MPILKLLYLSRLVRLFHKGLDIVRWVNQYIKVLLFISQLCAILYSMLINGNRKIKFEIPEKYANLRSKMSLHFAGK